jgi:hypothetical protein
MTTLTVKVPSWVKKEAAQEEFLSSLLGKALLKMEFYRSKMKPFETKYQLSFPEFQKRVESASKENFGEWDDLIEWEANYTAFLKWEERYKELEQWFEK